LTRGFNPVSSRDRLRKRLRFQNLRQLARPTPGKSKLGKSKLGRPTPRWPTLRAS
jgi:hypothetical protein